MKIDRLKIVNYKLFQNVMIEMNDSIIIPAFKFVTG